MRSMTSKPAPGLVDEVVIPKIDRLSNFLLFQKCRCLFSTILEFA
jgi:hypothetical protein